MAGIEFPKFLTSGVWVLGNYYYNLYLIKGQNACALVEVGVSAIVDEVIRQLEGLGASPDYLVVTHPHADHLTGLDGLRERFPQASVVAAPGAREFAEHPKAVEMLLAEDPHIHQVMEKLGHLPKRPPVDHSPSLKDCRLTQSGDEIDLGGVTLRFLEVKGHSPGNLAVHIPESDTLLLSDCFGIPYPGMKFLPMFFTGYADYVDTIDRLERLQARYLGLGHREPISGPAAERAFGEARRAAEDLLKLVRERESNGGRAELAEELFLDLFQEDRIIDSQENTGNYLKLLVRRCEEAL